MPISFNVTSTAPILEPPKEHIRITAKSVLFRHSGDLGDITAALPALRQLGGGDFVLSPHPFRNGGPREPMTQKRANFILPLLLAQPYVRNAWFEESPQGITHDFADIRITTYKNDAKDSLADWAAKHVGIDPEHLDTSPWLTVEPNVKWNGKIAVARSTRYRNRDFPWMRLLQRNKGNTVFIGTRDEHPFLLVMASGRLPRAECENALEMARTIAACSRFVGNQSFPLWVALGLGLPCTVECWKPSPDVRIKRSNCNYVFSKELNPDFYRTLA